MAGLITQVYKATVQDRKFLRKIAQDIHNGEKIYPSLMDKYTSMNKAFPRTKNPIVNCINWIRTFSENFYQMSSGLISKR